MHEAHFSAHAPLLRVQFRIQICRRAHQHGDILVAVADHGIAGIAQQAAYFVGRVVVIYYEFAFRLATNRTLAILTLEHHFVFSQRNAICVLEIGAFATFWIFEHKLAPLAKTAFFADWLYAVKTGSVFMKLSQSLILTAIITGLAFWNNTWKPYFAWAVMTFFADAL
jgi:hypothetical protein